MGNHLSLGRLGASCRSSSFESALIRPKYKKESIEEGFFNSFYFLDFFFADLFDVF